MKDRSPSTRWGLANSRGLSKERRCALVFLRLSGLKPVCLSSLPHCVCWQLKTRTFLDKQGSGKAQVLLVGFANLEARSASARVEESIGNVVVPMLN